MKSFLTPRALLKFCDRLTPMAFVGFVLTLFVGLWHVFFNSPSDYQQKELVKIMYVHVPASWGALGCYSLMAVMSLLGFVVRMNVFHIIAKAMAPVGLTLCCISLITGSIWGKPTWGTWWVWDARLTTMFLLFLMYVGHIGIQRKISNPLVQLKCSSVFVIITWINVPLIKYSVEWWYTLHQPASLTLFQKSAIASAFLWPLSWMTLSYILFSLTSFCLLLNVELRRAQRQAETYRLMQQVA